ncbi:ATPase [Macleaya cordata]|uniref:ATPase n=1 Tax=Macleaya cordata TaxID=56857 RepID=A0A200Q4G6_MACCD|nr:ATPase [Macleaya cordata]
MANRTPVASNNSALIAMIADEDTVTGFLLAGVGNVDLRRKTNYLIVDSKTTVKAIEDAFKDFTTREDIAIVLISQYMIVRWNSCKGVRMIPTRLQSSEEAEAKAALEAVKWGISLQLQKIQIEGDAQSIINYLTSTTNSSIGWRSKAHLDEARSLVCNYQSIFFFYVPRIVNSVADALASKARTSTSECSLTEVPSFIFDVLNSDSATLRALPAA